MRNQLTLHQRPSLIKEIISVFSYLAALYSLWFSKKVRTFISHFVLCSLLFVAVLLISWPFPGFKSYGYFAALIMTVCVFSVYDIQTFGYRKRHFYGYVFLIVVLALVSIFSLINYFSGWNVFNAIGIDFKFNFWWRFELITLTIAVFGFFCKIQEDLGELEEYRIKNYGPK